MINTQFKQSCNNKNENAIHNDQNDLTITIFPQPSSIRKFLKEKRTLNRKTGNFSANSSAVNVSIIKCNQANATTDLLRDRKYFESTQMRHRLKLKKQNQKIALHQQNINKSTSFTQRAYCQSLMQVLLELCWKTLHYKTLSGSDNVPQNVCIIFNEKTLIKCETASLNIDSFKTHGKGSYFLL